MDKMNENCRPRGLSDLTDEEVQYRIQKAVELEREGLKVMGIPLVQWDYELNCVVKIMPDGTKVKVGNYDKKFN